MLGVVRIYSKQVEYLANDANGALIKLRQVCARHFIQHRNGGFLSHEVQHDTSGMQPLAAVPCRVGPTKRRQTGEFS